ncbi:MAG TPA: PH domain-containing protein [Dermatophilaceae bacterium]|nr:PH domain-containing protein [Dermatophilaceae bacterium]
MLLVHPVRETARALPALLGLLIAGTSSGAGQFWVLAGVVAVVGFSVLRWFTTRFRITPEQVQLRTGMLRRRSLATPADRVRSVDVTASALHRLLGLAQVQIGTGDKDGGLVLDSLTAAEAARLRAELLHRAGQARAVDSPAKVRVMEAASAGASAGSSAGEPAEEVLLRFDPAWVRFAPFTTTGLVTAVAVLGAGWQLIDQVVQDDQEIGVLRSVGGRVLQTDVWLAVLVGAVGLAVFVTLLAVGGYVLSYWGFRLTRHVGGTLHTARGLLTTRATSLEERRLRGVELNDTLLLRAVHGARLEAVTTGLSSRASQESSKVLVPPAPVEVARLVGAAVLGQAEPLRVPLLRHGPGARRRRYVRALVSLLLPAVAVGLLVRQGLPAWLWVVPVVLVGPMVLLAADRYRSLGHALTDRFLVSQAGSLGRSRAVLATDGIIGWNLNESFFQRRAGLATLVATTAAGDQAYPVTDVPAREAVRLARAATPGLLDQFLEQDPDRSLR